MGRFLAILLTGALCVTMLLFAEMAASLQPAAAQVQPETSTETDEVLGVFSEPLNAEVAAALQALERDIDLIESDLEFVHEDLGSHSQQIESLLAQNAARDAEIANLDEQVKLLSEKLESVESQAAESETLLNWMIVLAVGSLSIMVFALLGFTLIYWRQFN